MGSIPLPEASLSGFSISNRQLSSKTKDGIKDRKRKNAKVNTNIVREELLHVSQLIDNMRKAYNNPAV